MRYKAIVILIGLITAGLLMADAAYSERPGRPGSGSAVGPMGPPGPPPGPPPGMDHGFGPGPGVMPGFGGPGMSGGFLNHPEVQKKLGLSDEQVEKLKANHRELEKRRIQTEADLEIARMEMEDLLRADELDKEAIDKQVETIGDLHKQQIRGMVDHIVAIHDILDSSQLEKIRGFMDKMRAHRGGGFEGRWGDNRRDRGEKGRDQWRGPDGDRRGPDGDWRGPDGKRRGPEGDRRGPEGDRGPRDGRHRGDQDGRRPGPPPPPREGRAPMPDGPGGFFGLGQAPDSFDQNPQGPPPFPPDGPVVGDDLADLGPALDLFLNPEE